MRKTLIRAAAIGASALIAVSFAHATETKPSKKKAAAPAAAAAPAPASPEQLAAAERVHIGESQCEFKQSVDLAHNATYPGYVDLTYGKRKYLMKPVLSGTGAMRLEDVRGETLYLQIANKSMLMNVKSGQRMVDDCVHANQRAVADALKAAAAHN